MAIEHYEFGRIRIDGQTYTSDVIIWPAGVDDSWWREEGHSLCEADLEPILSRDPEVLIIGTGARGAMTVPRDMVGYMEEHCDEVYVERTEHACERYNELCDGPKRVVAGLHLTC